MEKMPKDSRRTTLHGKEEHVKQVFRDQIAEGYCHRH